MMNKLSYILNISYNLISIMFFYDNFYYEFKYNLWLYWNWFIINYFWIIIIIKVYKNFFTINPFDIDIPLDKPIYRILEKVLKIKSKKYFNIYF